MISGVNRVSGLGLLITLTFLLMSGCSAPQQRSPLKLEGRTQGTYFSVIYYDLLNRNFQPEIDSLLALVDQSVSVYNQHALISRINRNETDTVDSIFAENFILSQEVSEASEGAFDCTIGQLIEAWGWGFSKRDSVSPAMIDSLRAVAGYRKVRLEGHKLVRDDTAIAINFNAIAQGYTSDIIARFLTSRGVHSFLIDVGGELVLKGTKPDGSFWRVGVELPDEEAAVVENLNDRMRKADLYTTDIGLATSGNYRKFYVQDGIKYSHTIDPATGYPVTHSLLSVTVLAPTAAVADAWATAFMVMGLEKAKSVLIKHSDLEAYFIYSNEQGVDKTWMSPGLKEIVTEFAN